MLNETEDFYDALDDDFEDFGLLVNEDFLEALDDFFSHDWV
jgi:hypothetical protein